MLKLEKITAQAGSFKLEPLDLEIASGQCHALLGPSGAGKSTILELIVGFRELQSGQIHLNGLDLARIPVERRNIGYLPQQLALFPHLTVKENILYGIRCRRRPDRNDSARVSSLIEDMALTQLVNRRPAHLSGGERQRVALARALAPAPELLILDEPFSALNEALRRELWVMLKELQRTYGVTTLMVTHDLEEAFFFGEKVHILIGGCLHQSASRRRVFDHPATLEVARFLGIQNLFSAKAVRTDRRGTIFKLTHLGMELNIENEISRTWNIPNGGDVTIGIRPEFVNLHLDDAADNLGNARLKGEVKDVCETISEFIVSFKPRNSEALVKLSVNAQQVAMLKHKEIDISLPSHRLFCVPANNSKEPT